MPCRRFALVPVNGLDRVRTRQRLRKVPRPWFTFPAADTKWRTPMKGRDHILDGQ